MSGMRPARPWRTWFRLALVVTALGAAVAPTRARAGYAEVGAAVTRANAERRVDGDRADRRLDVARSLELARRLDVARRIDVLCRAAGDGRAHLGRRLGFERRVDFGRFGGGACVRERLAATAPLFASVASLSPIDLARAPFVARLYLRNQSLLL
jgi:hypothetical protein